MQKKRKHSLLLSDQEVQDFCSMIKLFYKENKRVFPWRSTQDPYAIFVSEVMLQQTQTDRVVSKYEQFMKHFPSWYSVATSSLHDVMKLWQGLGYNRRARVILREQIRLFPFIKDCFRKIPMF
jgi:A/G-specific adenine glycosylase